MRATLSQRGGGGINQFKIARKIVILQDYY